jgi:hypothetical protein
MYRFALFFMAFLFAGATLAVADDLEDAYANLTEATGKKDPAQIKATAVLAIAAARAAQVGQAPQDPEQKEAWSKRIGSAREVEGHAEYALYSTALQSPPEVTVDLLATLEQQSPKSKYLDGAYANYFDALRKTGAGSTIPAVAEKALASLPNNADCLLFLADAAMTAKNGARALGFAEKLVAALNKASAPEGLLPADWNRKKSDGLGRGYWMVGMVYSERQQHAQADRNLRAALPYIKGNDALMGPALFCLGLANYTLGTMTNNKARVLEAAKFSEQAAGIKGPYAEQAGRNIRPMQDAAAKMR